MTESWTVELMRVTYDRVGHLVKLHQMVALSLMGILFGACYYTSAQKSWSTSKAAPATRTVYDLPWRSLERGMTADEVRALFNAEPRRISVSAVHTYWYYSEEYAYLCYVYFDSDAMTVEGWREPG